MNRLPNMRRVLLSRDINRTSCKAIRRAVIAIAILSGGCIVAACDNRRWDNMKAEARATVDGHPVRASTIWRTTVIDTFPTGSNMPVTGSALAIPIAPKYYVYGLLRAVSGKFLADWSLIPSAIDVYALDQEQKRTGSFPGLNSRSDIRRWVLSAWMDKQIPLCISGKGFAGQDRCLLFVYFRDPSNPQSVERLVPGDRALIGGHVVVINSFSVGFVTGGDKVTPTGALPSWLSKRPLPSLRRIDGGNESRISLQLQVSDFKRIK